MYVSDAGWGLPLRLRAKTQRGSRGNQAGKCYRQNPSTYFIIPFVFQAVMRIRNPYGFAGQAYSRESVTHSHKPISESINTVSVPNRVHIYQVGMQCITTATIEQSGNAFWIGKLL